METICFGDWHGNAQFAADALDAARRAGHAHLIHVGDFGLWPGRTGKRYLDAVSEALGDSVLHVVPGNHEYWPGLTLADRTFAFASIDPDGFLQSRRHPAIRVCPRINYWQWEGTRFAALAGANSIDFEHRHEGVSWWPEEAPTQRHVDELVQLVGDRGVDVLVTHDAPADAITALGLYSKDRQAGWSDAALAYANKSAVIVATARDALEPAVHVCGHHHVRQTGVVGGTRVEMLADDSGTLRNNRIEISKNPQASV